MVFRKRVVCCWLVFAVGLFYSAPVNAQGAFGNYGTGGYRDSSGLGKRTTGLAAFKSEQQNSGVWGRRDDGEIKPTRQLADLMHPDTLRTLFQAERVACYGVKSKLPGEDVPTFISYRHRGNCGLVDIDTLDEFKRKIFADKDSLDFKSQKPVCVHAPQVVFRFVRGADFVHVVIPSTTCPVIDVIYGDVPTLTLNALPVREWLGEYLEKIERNMTEFESLDAAQKGLLPLVEGMEGASAAIVGAKEKSEEEIKEAKPKTRVRRSWAKGDDKEDDNNTEKKDTPQTKPVKGWVKKPWGR